MWSVYLFQVTSGHIGPKLEISSLRWSLALNDMEDITVEINKSDLPMVNLKKWLSPWWAGIVVMWNGTPIVAGPIINRPAEFQDKISLTAAGIRSILARRTVSHELNNWDGLAESKVSFKGLGLGTIAKYVVEQAQSKAGGRLPITYVMADETAAMDADHERNYRGFNLQNIDADSVLTKLSNVIDGPDIMFRPKLVADNQLTFELWTGTDKQPRIYQKHSLVWDTTAENGEVSDVQIGTTGAYQTFRTYSIGAGQDEGTLIKVNTNHGPLGDQYPLLETVVKTSDSENPVVVNNHGVANLFTNKEPLTEVQLTVRGDGVYPFGTFWPGDLVQVVFKGWHGIPDGIIPMRLLSLSGDISSDVRVSLQPESRFA